MKKIGKILFVIFIFLLVIAGGVYIDFFIAKSQNTYPKISIKKRIDDSLSVYNAPFYRVWYCKDNDTYTIGDYSDSDAVCSITYVYDGGYYTNGAELKIPKKSLEMIKKNYDPEVIELFNNESSINDAVYVSEKYAKLDYNEVKDENGKVVKVDKYTLIRIPDFKEVNDKYAWVYDDKKEYCLDIKDNKKYYALYNEEEGTCGEFELLDIDEKWCSLYVNSKFSFDEELVEKCKGVENEKKNN